MLSSYEVFFFFQAEDGIRDADVTGVQTCALPISTPSLPRIRCTMSHMATVDSIVHCDPQILGGTPVFRGTRVPVKNLIDYLAGGDTLNQFLDDFPTLSREQAGARSQPPRNPPTARAA